MLKLEWRTVRESVETLAIVSACAAVLITLSGRSSSPSATSSTPPQVAEDISAKKLTLHLSPNQTLGSEGAPLAVIEFSDCECPFCGRYARDTFPKLRAEFVDTARARLAFKHFPLEQIHLVARAAARHATFAGKQSRFWEMHARLFSVATPLSNESLAAAPTFLNLDRKAFDQCLPKADVEIGIDQQDGRRLGVSSTPTIFIGRVTGKDSVMLVTRIAGAYPYETMAAAINAAAIGAPRRQAQR